MEAYSQFSRPPNDNLIGVVGMALVADVIEPTDVRPIASNAPHGAIGLASEPCPAPDTEPRLQRPVLLSVLERCPDEQATDNNGGQDDDE